MGARGPKAVDIGTLHVWEFEWFKALHFLRDGMQLPEPARPRLTTEQLKRLDARIKVLEKLPLDKIVATQESDGIPPAPDYRPAKPGDRSPLDVWTPWAESQRSREIGKLLSMKPREIRERAERRQIWQTLWNSKSPSGLAKACDRWSALDDVKGIGMDVFPAHVKANAPGFIAITRSPRFPKSTASDDARIDYLARGMAGVMMDVSPMTGIERLRNMKHDRSGRFWDRASRLCGCWRCNIDRWYEAETEARKADTI